MRVCCTFCLLLRVEASAVESIGIAPRIDASALVQGRLAVHTWRGEAEEEQQAGEDQWAEGEEGRPLPAGWTSAVDPSTGNAYYWPANDRSAVTWERPTTPVEGAAASGAGEDGQFEDVEASPAALIAKPGPGSVRAQDAEVGANSSQKPRIKCVDRLKAAQQELEEKASELAEKNDRLKQASNDKILFNQDLLRGVQNRLKASESRQKECMDELGSVHAELSTRRTDQAAATERELDCQAELNRAKGSADELADLRVQLQEKAEAAHRGIECQEKLGKALALEEELEAARRKLNEKEAAEHQASNRTTGCEATQAALKASDAKAAELTKEIKRHEEEADLHVTKCKDEMAQNSQALKDRIAALTEGNKALEKDQEALNERIAQAEGRTAKCEELCERNLNSTRTRCDAADAKAAELEKRAVSLTQQLEQCSAGLARRGAPQAREGSAEADKRAADLTFQLDSERSRAAERAGNLTLQLELAKAAREAQEAKLQEAERHAQRDEAKAREAGDRAASLTLQLEVCKVDLAGQRERCDGSKQHVHEAELKAAEAVARVANLTLQLDLAAERVSQCKGEQKEQRDQMQDMEKRLRTAEVRNSVLDERLKKQDALEDHAAKMEVDLQRLTDQNSELGADLKAASAQNEELKTQNAELAEHAEKTQQALEEQSADEEAGTTRFYHRKWLECDEKTKAESDRARRLERDIQSLQEKMSDTDGSASSRDALRRRVIQLEGELERQRGINAEHMLRWQASEARIEELMQQLRTSQDLSVGGEAPQEAPPRTVDASDISAAPESPAGKPSPRGAARGRGAGTEGKTREGSQPPAGAINEAATPPSSLPPGWRALWSEADQDYYYWHIVSGNTSWTLPSLGAKLQEPPEAALLTERQPARSMPEVAADARVPGRPAPHARLKAAAQPAPPGPPRVEAGRPQAAAVPREEPPHEAPPPAPPVQVFQAGDPVDVRKRDTNIWSRGIVVHPGQKPDTYDVRFPISSTGATTVIEGIPAQALRQVKQPGPPTLEVKQPPPPPPTLEVKQPEPPPTLEVTPPTPPTFEVFQNVEVQYKHGTQAGTWTKAIVLGHGEHPGTYDIRVPAGPPTGYQVIRGVHASALRADESAGAAPSERRKAAAVEPAATPPPPAPAAAAVPAAALPAAALPAAALPRGGGAGQQVRQQAPQQAPRQAPQLFPRQAHPTASPRLQPGWRAIWSEADRASYYWNAETGETTWDAPVADEGARHAPH